MVPSKRVMTLAAIDVGTNAVRLEVVRVLPDGTLQTMHQERDAVRPGEGIFTEGTMSQPVADRLLATLRRYSALCRRFSALTRAVATSALREARNKNEIVRRAKKEANLDLQVVSGMEEARLICLGVLHGKPARERSLCIDIGGGSTEVASAVGEKPTQLWSIALGGVRLTQLFDAAGEITARQLKLMRRFAEEAIEEALPRRIPGAPTNALGSSGTISAVISFASAQSEGHITPKELTKAVDKLVQMGPHERRKRFDSQRAEVVVAGAVILEAVATHLSLKSITTVQRGLRHGILVDLLRQQKSRPADHSLFNAAEAIGKHFFYDERHSKQVARLALSLFDGLSALHKLPDVARSFLEVACLLHDIGNAVNYRSHHKHTFYLIQNADIPGLSDRERELVARIARYHRRSAPDYRHSGMGELSRIEANTVRKLATLLRIADSLDRSHHQPVQKLKTKISSGGVNVLLFSRGPVDLEMWDAEHEAMLFRRVFGKKVVFQADADKRSGSSKR